jgi:hypothetical protein
MHPRPLATKDGCDLMGAFIDPRSLEAGETGAGHPTARLRTAIIALVRFWALVVRRARAEILPWDSRDRR